MNRFNIAITVYECQLYYQLTITIPQTDMRKKTTKNHHQQRSPSKQKVQMSSIQNQNNLQEDITKIYSSYLKLQDQNQHPPKYQHGYYITMQMHGNGFRPDRQKNRKISEIMATNELLSIAGTDKLHENLASIQRSKSRSKSRSRSRSGNHSSFKHLNNDRGLQDNRNNIIHGVYNRSHLSSQHSVKENNHKTLQSRESVSRNGRNISNFQRLKLEAEKLEKSNVVLGIKQENNQNQRKTSAKELTIKQCLGQYKNQNSNYTKTQRYRYKQNLTNRYKNNEKQTNSQNTLTDMKTYYHHITNQIHNRSTHKLSTEGDREVSFGTQNRQGQDMSENQAGQAQILRKGSMKNHYKSASEWGIGKKYSRDFKVKDDNTPTNSMDPNLNTQKPLDKTQAQIVHVSSDQYMINNEFIPMVNRSILDKNRQNIKKISKNVNRILSSKYAKGIISQKNDGKNRCSTVGDETNENIDQFIRNKMSILDLSSNYDQSFSFKHPQRNMLGLQSAHNKSMCSYNRAQNQETKKNLDILIQDTQNLKDQKTIRNQSASKNNRNKKINSEPELKINTKVDTTNAAKFYKPQFEKFKGKAGLMIVDPHLKTKAIQISTKEIKKNNDIVIICL